MGRPGIHSVGAGGVGASGRRGIKASGLTGTAGVQLAAAVQQQQEKEERWMETAVSKAAHGLAAR